MVATGVINMNDALRGRGQISKYLLFLMERPADFIRVSIGPDKLQSDALAIVRGLLNLIDITHSSTRHTPDDAILVRYDRICGERRRFVIIAERLEAGRLGHKGTTDPQVQGQQSLHLDAACGIVGAAPRQKPTLLFWRKVAAVI
jgi:hypothetical protein